LVSTTDCWLQIYCSTSFYPNESKHKLLYIRSLLVRIGFTKPGHSKQSIFATTESDIHLEVNSELISKIYVL